MAPRIPPLGSSATLTTVLLTASLVLAGCLTLPGDDIEEQGVTDVADRATDAARGVVAHTPLGDVVDLPPELRDLRVRLVDTGHTGAEPTLGVTSDGTVFTNPYDHTGLIRSTDHGLTWEEVGSDLHDPPLNFDPWMFVDPDTDRVFNGPLYVACSWLAWSDDQGETWESNPIAGCGYPAHDHQKITAGPPAPDVETSGYENVVYYAYNGAFRGLVDLESSSTEDMADGTWVHVSYDGGRTFTTMERVFDPSPCKSGINGPVEVAPDGTAYVAHLTCEGVQVAVSEDSGGSWDAVAHLTSQGTYPGLIPDPYLATDTESNVYLATPGGDGLLYTSVSLSTERGRQWTEPIPVTPPNVTFTVLPVLTAGEPGHVAFAYLGTTDDVSTWERPEPSYARDEAVWHLYYTYTDDLLADDPTFVTVQVTPDDDPVQRGCVWLYGGGNPCRNLLDFIDMVHHEGRPYIAFTDGCDACETAEDSRERMHRLAILEEGPSLLGGVALDELVPLGS